MQRRTIDQLLDVGDGRAFAPDLERGLREAIERGIEGVLDGSTQPLTLTGGTHRIDIEARGFAPLTFDVGVQPGQVIPYRGDLQPY